MHCLLVFSNTLKVVLEGKDLRHLNDFSPVPWELVHSFSCHHCKSRTLVGRWFNVISGSKMTVKKGI